MGAHCITDQSRKYLGSAAECYVVSHGHTRTTHIPQTETKISLLFFPPTSASSSISIRLSPKIPTRFFLLNSLVYILVFFFCLYFVYFLFIFASLGCFSFAKLTFFLCSRCILDFSLFLCSKFGFLKLSAYWVFRK